MGDKKTDLLSKYSDELKEVPNRKVLTKDVTLQSAAAEENYNERLSWRAVVAGKDLAPYQIPKTLEISCPIKGSFDRCKGCRLPGKNFQCTVEVKDPKQVMEFINVSSSQVHGTVRHMAGIPKCSSWKIDKEVKMNVEEIKLIPEVEFIDTDDFEYVVRTAYFIGSNMRTNKTYLFEGTTIPDPKNQQVIHIADEAIPVKDNIENWKITDKIRAGLQIFKKGEQSIEDKLEDIYGDLAHNVTKIYHRSDLLLAYDLVFHSALSFNFLGERIAKGWCELFVLGDSRTGKTKTIQALLHHYRAGERISAENTSIAGLIAGLQQTQSRWTLMWGKIPLNDKRLLVIDEASGLKPEDFAQLSDTRSSGVVEVTKIQIQKTRARTRLIFISNPKKKRIVEFSYGVFALKEIIGQNEDISRFDLAISVADIDVPEREINTRHDNKVEHVYTEDKCHDLVMFAWSRKEDQIEFTREAEDAILKYASEFSETFSKVIPLVQGAEIRIKLAKLSVALAIRIYNVNDSGEVVVVTKPIVDYIRKFLFRIYGKPGFDYLEFSKQSKKESTIADTETLDRIITNQDRVDLMLNQTRHSLSDFEIILELDRVNTKECVAKLMRSRAIKKYYSSYEKTPAFIQYLKERKIYFDQHLKDGEITV